MATARTQSGDVVRAEADERTEVDCCIASDATFIVNIELLFVAASRIFVTQQTVSLYYTRMKSCYCRGLIPPSLSLSLYRPLAALLVFVYYIGLISM